MILFELSGNENDSAYRSLEVSNINRQYDFLRSVVFASLEAKQLFLSSHVIKALNFHAITCLHINAGEYRPCGVTVGGHKPPEHYRVQALMDEFVNKVNRIWENSDPLALTAYVLWRLNYIHPFINGNGRTARAISYFVLCLKLEKWLPGTTILPELIRKNRKEYIQALQVINESYSKGNINVSPLQLLIERLLNEQINGMKNT